MHTPLFVKLAEIWIPQVFNKTDRFARALHFGA